MFQLILNHQLPNYQITSLWRWCLLRVDRPGLSPRGSLWSGSGGPHRRDWRTGCSCPAPVHSAERENWSCRLWSEWLSRPPWWCSGNTTARSRAVCHRLCKQRTRQRGGRSHPSRRTAPRATHRRLLRGKLWTARPPYSHTECHRYCSSWCWLLQWSVMPWQIARLFFCQVIWHDATKVAHVFVNLVLLTCLFFSIINFLNTQTLNVSKKNCFRINELYFQMKKGK